MQTSQLSKSQNFFFSVYERLKKKNNNKIKNKISHKNVE